MAMDGTRGMCVVKSENENTIAIKDHPGDVDWMMRLLITLTLWSAVGMTHVLRS